MIKTTLIIFISALFIFIYNSQNFLFPFKKIPVQPQNNAPIVRIISPKNNSDISRGSQMHYSITVSDKEDGESKFDEINPKEVLLQVKYLNDTSALHTAKKIIENDPPGLAAIRTSNCLNCHAFENKVIGPGFNEIAKRYQPTGENISLLEKRIFEGSKGIWGKEAMPTHPELTAEQIENIVNWIMQNGTAGDVHYYVGTESSFKIPTDLKSNFLLLSASYTDHGINNKGDRLKGQDVILLRVK
jgi:cytochrome c